MSALTNLNRWYRYQVARIDGLVGGLAAEARTLGRDDLEQSIAALGDALREELERHMLARRESLRADDTLEAPGIRFDRM